MAIIRPEWPIKEFGLQAMVTKDQQIDDGDVSQTVDITLQQGSETEAASGVILSWMFVTAETGSGAVLTPAGRLFIFNADPNTTSGDTDFAAAGAEHKTLVGVIKVAASDWVSDASGGVAFIYDQPVYFHQLATLYLVWEHADATAINSAAGDDETLDLNAWWLQYS